MICSLVIIWLLVLRISHFLAILHTILDFRSQNIPSDDSFESTLCLSKDKRPVLIYIYRLTFHLSRKVLHKPSQFRMLFNMFLTTFPKLVT